MSSWYRRFLPQFAKTSEPLTRLLRKHQGWEWGDEQNKASEKIRFGLGAVLAQEVNGVENIIAFASRGLLDTERRYSVTEQECLAVIWAIRKFRPYLEGYRFTVVTDHNSLRWLHHLWNPTGRALNHARDALSITFGGDSEAPGEELETFLVALGKEVKIFRDTENPWYRAHFREVSEGKKTLGEWRVTEYRLYVQRQRPVAKTAAMEDLDEWKLAVLRELRGEVLRESHDDPQAEHLGIDKIHQKLSIVYYWPNMFRAVADYVGKCDTCQRAKVEQVGPMGLMGRRVVEAPWIAVAAGIMGPLPRAKAGFVYVLVVQDLFTKWMEYHQFMAGDKRANKSMATRNIEVFQCTDLHEWYVTRVVEPILASPEEFQKRDSGWALSLVTALYPAQGNTHRTSSYTHYTSVLNLVGIEFLMTLSQIKKFEVLNDISINVHAIEKGIVPIRLDDRKSSKHINLLYVEADNVGHFALIKDLSRLRPTLLQLERKIGDTQRGLSKIKLHNQTTERGRQAVELLRPLPEKGHPVHYLRRS
ncbi:PREDICTED: uncharacterized protein LOC108764694 [Trachymyrmex cornetzi]|uniref:uncharacterized protein LOC108764694 n=1 Tax=Trachymyrmex cornetzi TaxID=471704 RepID=UPI00084F7DC3|nr:PREDICTED: uncharacterized protein LOC108764694 [Trachymyrmex cornetzi]